MLNLPCEFVAAENLVIWTEAIPSQQHLAGNVHHIIEHLGKVSMHKTYPRSRVVASERIQCRY